MRIESPPDSVFQAHRIMVIAEDSLARRALDAVIAQTPRFELVGSVSGRAGIASEVGRYGPDAVVWDFGVDNDRAGDRLSEVESTEVAIVALMPDGAHSGEALRAGVRAALPRDADPEALVATLHAVLRGMVVIDPRYLLEALAQGASPVKVVPRDAAIEPLTAREREVLQRLGEGMANKAIAERLKISEHTVKFHVNAVMAKLGVTTRTEAVVRAARIGLLVF